METKSKSWRGPGEFLREYLIIVIGVLTALGGQQAVDWIHQQNELAETREALRDEIAQNGNVITLGAALDRCRSAMLEKYAALGARRPPAGEIRLGRLSETELQRLGRREIGSAFQDAGQGAPELFPGLRHLRKGGEGH